MRWIGLSMVFVLSFVPAVAFAADTSKPAKEASDNASVAVFELNGPVTESQVDNPFDFDTQPVSLRELTRRIRAAGDDANVKAVVLLAEHVWAGRAQIEELRQAIKDLRGKDKDVYVHSDMMLMGDYLLYSGASRISLSPTGIVLVNGLHGEQPYLRGLLDKIGVKPDFIHCGAYKSAVELFMRDGPSKEADEMYNWLMDGIYSRSIQLIAEGRKADEAKVKQWIDTALYSAEAAKDAGLIDAVEQREDFDAMLKKKYGEGISYDRKYGEKKKPALDFLNPFAMFQLLGQMMGGGAQKAKPTGPAVGIVYVDGGITTGSAKPSLFGPVQGAYSDDIRKALDKAARDDSIKAVVLRIDSPGGSATASEIILDATRRVKAKKPLVVSMGDVAGSGGYFVALASDTIFADESTITGSIGVLGGKFATNDMWKKVGITFKSYDRGANSNLFASDALWSDAQKEQVQNWMNDVYDVFKKHVTDIRGDRLKKPIDDLAGGRVYTGKQALDLGLVDKIGTLSDAIAFAADKAGLSGEYDVRTVPEPKNFIEQLLEKSSGNGNDDDKRWMSGGSSSLVDLAMPYLKGLDPARVAAVRSELEKLQMLNHEGVLLAMPEGCVFN